MEEHLKDYSTELRSIIDKSNDYFEKQLNYISAGALGLSMIIVEKIIQDLSNSTCKVLLFFSWALFAATLLSNLLSHVYTSQVHAKTLEEINEEKYSYEAALSRNKKIRIWNYFSISFLISGIAFLILYITLNLSNMSNDVTKPSLPSTGTKGTTSTNPPKPQTGTPSSQPPAPKK